MVQIVDASVAIKWFVQEPGTDRALDILGKIIRRPNAFAVPELFYFELAHVFKRVIPKPLDKQLNLLNETMNLGLYRFSMTPELLKEIQELQEIGLSGYDASYVGLAKITKGCWLTFDQKAHSIIQHLNLSELLAS